MSDIIPSDTPQKQCARCKTWKNLADFGIDKHTRDGRSSSCKECYRYARKHPKEKPIVPDGYRRCAVCTNILPATTEYFYRNARFGLNYRCIACEKLNNQKNYQAHKESRNLATRQYYIDHKASTIAYAKAYAEKHREADRKSKSKWKKSHPLERRASTQKYRAIKKGIAGTYTPQQIEAQLKRQKHRCYYAACGYAKFKKRNGKYVYHIDHTFPLSRVAGTDIPANDIGYLVLTCPSCNQTKNDKFPWEWPEGGRLL